MGIAENGFRHVTNNKRPIESLADMKDLVIRVAGAQVLKDEYEVWGTNYTTANWSEVYTGLQTGTYEAQENPLPTADASSISDVQDYVTYWTGVYDCIFFTMNQDLYDSFSPEMQALIDEAGAYAANNQRQLEREGDEEFLADNQWITKLMEDREDEIRPCILCHNGCFNLAHYKGVPNDQDLYDSLSPELQALVDEAGAWAAAQQRQLEREGDQEVLDKWSAGGMTVSTLSDEAVQDFKDAAAGVPAKFVQTCVGLGFDQAEVEQLVAIFTAE